MEMSTKKVATWKKEVIQKIEGNLQTYKMVAAANLDQVRSSQIHEVRKKLRGKVQLLVAKNTLVKKAAEESKKKNIEKFTEKLLGSRMLLFSDIAPHALVLLLDKNKVRVPAKGGDVATGEIVVPAGNTGLAPGPVISEFGEAKVPTKIESGSIWVAKDTVVARKGDVISPKLASVLSKLGIKPMELGLSLVAAYDDGVVFEEGDLKLDLEEFRTNFRQAASQAFNLAVNSGYLLPETAPQILGKAYREAISLAVAAEYPAEEALPQIIREAYMQMLGLSAKVGSKTESSPTEKPQEAKSEEKIEKKEKT
jgi:large subunit ribosomal protein L10